MRSLTKIFHYRPQTIISKLYYCAMENIAANIVNVAKNTMWLANESNLLNTVTNTSISNKLVLTLCLETYISVPHTCKSINLCYLCNERYLTISHMGYFWLGNFQLIF